MWAKIRCLFFVAFLVFGFWQTVSAELVGVGPTDTTKKLPQWYQDGNGLALELCLATGICIFEPPVPGNTFSQTIGFGEKASYWFATAQLTGAGAQGNLEMALVASFSGSTTGPIPADGEQIVFFQIAVGPITGLTAGGVYRVIHPYGVIENLVADGSGTIPRHEQDIGCATAPCDFTAVIGSALGPFLRWDPAVAPAAPSGFIGNPATAHAVVGSPFGTNFFRIEGANAGGAGLSSKQTNLFKVQGKIFSGATPIPLTLNRATYTRPLPPQIEVLASSLPGRFLDVSGTGIPPGTTMTPDGNGNYFAQIFNPPVFPSSITVTVRGTTTSVTSDLIDIVTITLAEFNPMTSTMTVQASSSDSVAPLPTLTVLGFGDLVGGSLVVPGVTVPPAQVIVVSSAGGSATAPVSVIARPLAVNDTALTLRTMPVVVGVLGNDIPFGSGNSLDPGTVAPNTPPKGTAVPTGTGGITYDPTGASFTLPVEKVIFNYTVKDIFAQVSNGATVTVTVAEADVTTITKGQFTRRTKSWQISGKSKTSAATTGKAIPGNKITVYLGPVVGGTVIGTATVNAYGNWTFSKIKSPVDPDPVGATQISVQSALGTSVLAFPITFR